MARLSVLMLFALAVAVQSASLSQRVRRSPDDSSEGGWLDTIKGGLSKAKSEVDKAVETVENSDVYKGTKNQFSKAGEAISDFSHDAVDKVTKFGQSTGDKISEFGKDTKDKVVEIGQGTGEKLSEIGHSISDKVSSGLSAAGDKFSEIKESDTVQDTKKSISKTVDNIKDKFDD